MNHANFYLELKFVTEAGLIEGLAAGYGNTDAHGESFAPGAFAKSIAAFKAGGRKPAMLLHHDARRPAGRWDQLTETAAGLKVAGTLAIDAADGREAYALLKAGALSRLSVGYREIAAKNASRRIITEAELFEISLTATPSNPKTHISGVKGIGDERDLVELLREHGYSRRKAAVMAAAAWQASLTPDPTPNPEHTRAAAILADATAALRGIFKEL